MYGLAQRLYVASSFIIYTTMTKLRQEFNLIRYPLLIWSISTVTMIGISLVIILFT
jgi:hypothetical protein